MLAANSPINRKIPYVKYACIHKLIWNDIEIELWHTHEFFKHMDHIAVHSKDQVPLPITETGYKSIFILRERLLEYGNPIGLVKPWLDEEAKSQAWQLAQDQGRQMSLF